MASANLKLYEIMDDMYDKAILLAACIQSFIHEVVFSSFANHCISYHSWLI